MQHPIIAQEETEDATPQEDVQQLEAALQQEPYDQKYEEEEAEIELEDAEPEQHEENEQHQQPEKHQEAENYQEQGFEVEADAEQYAQQPHEVHHPHIETEAHTEQHAQQPHEVHHLHTETAPQQDFEQTTPARKERAKRAGRQADSVEASKCLKIIFSHFCKENYISSIKSTLFEDKKKSMEEMPLNKWMVFCKEFDVFSRLASFKIQQRHREEEGAGESSRVRERVKETKEVEKLLGSIFRKATENQTKMELPHFLQAVKLLAHEFIAGQESLEQSELNFAKQYLYCQSEHECMQKLSNLKFTFGIPQIDYSKTPQADKPKTKLTTDLKENMPEGRKTKLEESKMHLNPIIKEAKNALNAAESRGLPAASRKLGSKMKLTLDQPRRAGKREKEGKREEKGVSELLSYLQSTKDDILESYFKGEKLSAVQKAK